MNIDYKSITIVGLGYIGLPTATAFSSVGVRVHGVDINQNVVERVNRGEIHIIEPGLEVEVKRAVKKGLLTASIDVKAADAFLIAVPTPFKDNKEPDLSYLYNAIKNIAPVLQKGNLIVLESTSPVGTTEKLMCELAKLRSDLKFPNSNDKILQGDTSKFDIDVNFAYCPERVLPGKIMQEVIDNDRIIGGITNECAERAKQLYQMFVKGECIITHSRTAEMCKLTENSFRDTNIAFANELSILCDEQGIDIWELIALANRHPRVNILQPGPGVGGHCIAVDPWFIVYQHPQKARLIKTAREVNDSKLLWVIDKIKVTVADYIAENDCKMSDVSIALHGLAFKANIDDLRESPALSIVQEISRWNTGTTLITEPNIQVLPDSLTKHDNSKNCILVNLEQACEKADITVLLVDHDEYKSYSSANLDKKWLIDTRGIWKRSA